MCPHPTPPSAPPAPPPPPINTEHYAATTPPTCHQHWLREQNTATTNRPTNPEYLDKYPLVYTRTSSQVSSWLFLETVSVGAHEANPVPNPPLPRARGKAGFSLVDATDGAARAAPFLVCCRRHLTL